MRSAEQIFRNLKGGWTFRRSISKNGLVHGNAVFTEINPNQFVYKETGLWKKDVSCAYQIYREYVYKYLPKENLISVHFSEEGKPLFHRIEFFSQGEETLIQGIGEHLCKQDLYQTFYFFYSKDKFTIFHKVCGPKKTYTSETVFKRFS